MTSQTILELANIALTLAVIPLIASLLRLSSSVNKLRLDIVEKFITKVDHNTTIQWMRNEQTRDIDRIEKSLSEDFKAVWNKLDNLK